MPVSLSPAGMPHCKRKAYPVRGFTLLELTVVICLVAILFAVAANRLWGLQVLAEQAAMDTVIGNLRSAVGMKVAQLYAKGDLAGLRALQGSNPMALMAETPGNYLGEQPAGVPQKGSWYFDAARRELVYRVKNTRYFQGGVGGQARFAMRLLYEDRNRNGAFDPGRDFILGVRLVAVEPYRWTE